MPRTMPRSVMVRTGISGSGTDSSTAMIAASSTVFIATPPMATILHPFERQRDSRADAHDPRRHARDGGAEDPGTRSQAVALRGFLGGDDDRGGAVVHPRRIAGGDGAVGADDGLELAKRLDRGLTRVLVLVDEKRV